MQRYNWDISYVNDNITLVPEEDLKEYTEDIASLIESYKQKDYNGVLVYWFDGDDNEPYAFASIFVHPYHTKSQKKITVGDEVKCHFTKRFVGVASHPAIYEQMRFIMERAEEELG
jgi:hypothetical protein